MRDLSAFCTALLLLGLSSAPAGALDLNAIANGEFEAADDVAGWVNLHPDYSVMNWNAEDADLCSLSGSMHVDNTQGTVDFATAQFNYCSTNVTPGESFQIGAHFRFIDGTALSRASLIVFFSETSTCSTINGIASGAIALSTTSGWQWSVTHDVVAPAGTQSVAARIHLVKVNAADAKAELRVDRVFIHPNGLIHADDFEIAETCRWSEQP